MHGGREPLTQEQAEQSHELVQELGPDEQALGLVVVSEATDWPPRPWLVDGLWPLGGFGFIGGEPKAGKSYLSLDFAIAVATGSQFLGRQLIRHGKVLYFIGEDDRGDTLARLRKLARGRGLTLDDLRARLLVTRNVPSLEDPERRARILGSAQNQRPTLVVFDSFTRFFTAADENSVLEMKVIAQFLREDLSRGCDTAVCVNHHIGKSSTGLRGTSDLAAQSEVTFLLHKTGPQSARVRVEMRSAPPPPHFNLSLLTTESEGIELRTSESHGDLGDQIAATRRFVIDAGPRGVSVDATRRDLGVRWSEALRLLREVGARQDPHNGRWTLD